MHRDKRKKARAAVHAQATIDYANVEQEKATLIDLAEDGMSVQFGKRLPPVNKVYFQFRLPGQTANIRLSGRSCGRTGRAAPACSLPTCRRLRAAC